MRPFLSAALAALVSLTPVSALETPLILDGGSLAVTIDPLKVKGTKLDSLGFAVGKKTITFKIPSKAQNDDEYTYSVVAFAANATYSVDPKLRIYN